MKKHVFEAFSYLKNRKNVFWEVFSCLKNLKHIIEAFSNVQHEKHTFLKRFWNVFQIHKMKTNVFEAFSTLQIRKHVFEMFFTFKKWKSTFPSVFRVYKM